VNSPDTGTGKFKDRPSAKKTGKLVLEIKEDLSMVCQAELYLELWGGHPGTRNKRFTLNGRTEYELPGVGAADKNCTYSYPLIPLKLSDLKRGANEFQFTCEKGSSFWGHYIVRAACVRLFLNSDHPDLVEGGLGDFSALVRGEKFGGGGEKIRLTALITPDFAKRIASVEYWGRYRGYDENGNNRRDDWHGFTLDREPVGVVGVATAPPFELDWDVSMLLDQNPIAVRATVHFKDFPELIYVTRPCKGIAIAKRKRARVRLYSPEDLPRPFWSRVGRRRTCVIPLDVSPKQIERAELHIVVWDGGKGSVKTPLKLNAHPLDVAHWRGGHDLIYTVFPIAPDLLRMGDNEVLLLSDTKHHGIEVCLPGPALVVRKKLPKDLPTPQE
jgi:hypothetical protein